jgi:hypothetical protein
MDDRDRLIAETLAFAKTVGAAQPKPPEPQHSVLVEEVEQIQSASPSTFEPPVFERIAALPRRNEREEIANRLASFKSTQLRFHREREQFCSVTLSDALNATLTAPPKQPHS